MTVTRVIVCIFLFAATASAQTTPAPAAFEPWTFAVSGDSRNCGDVVMPAIAAAVKAESDAFYWHLGDLRKTTAPDEDWLFEQKNAYAVTPTREEYLKNEWDDFTEHQVKPFEPVPFLLGIGNHEVVAPKTESDYLTQFQKQLDIPLIKTQRLMDDPNDVWVHTWFHVIVRGVDFITLDNAVDSNFGAVQLAWFEHVIARDEADASVKTIVVGMHEALPWSTSADHSMCQSETGIVEGDKVYHRLMQAKDKGKNIYILASHSHYYMANTFDTPHWNDPKNGVVLPGWIVGSAGAERYPLPAGTVEGPEARQHIYGYLRGTVLENGMIVFEFVQLTEDDLQKARTPDFTEEQVLWCYVKNPAKLNPPPDRSCEDTAAAESK
jgi:hypothetical protein